MLIEVKRLDLNQLGVVARARNSSSDRTVSLSTSTPVAAQDLPRKQLDQRPQDEKRSLTMVVIYLTPRRISSTALVPVFDWPCRRGTQR